MVSQRTRIAALLSLSAALLAATLGGAAPASAENAPPASPAPTSAPAATTPNETMPAPAENAPPSPGSAATNREVAAAPAENAPPSPESAVTAPDGTAPVPAENAPPSPAPQVVTVQYKNWAAFNGDFCLHNAKFVKLVNSTPIIGGRTGDDQKCQFSVKNVNAMPGEVTFHEVEFVGGTTAKTEACAVGGKCEKLEVPIGPNTNSLCFETTGSTMIDFNLFQVDCTSRNRIAS